MPIVEAHGISALVPPGFEGRVFRRRRVADEDPRPVAHFATFALPQRVGDFGGGAVERMGPTDLFVVLFEYGPDSVGSALFARQGMPRRLRPEHFRPTVLRRGLADQAGSQWFFTEAGRAFTLYAVLGSYAMRFILAPRLDPLLEGIVIDPSEVNDPVDASPPAPTATRVP